MKTSFTKGLMAATAFTTLLSGTAYAKEASPPTHLSCPAGFDAGDAAGVRICHHHGAWRLETTDPVKAGPHEYTGTLTTDGKFTDVQLIRPEDDDSAGLDGDGKLVYDFKTYSGIDGVAFHVSGEATELTFNLFVDGQQLPPARIWIGEKGRHPKSDPFTLHAGKR